MSEESEDFFIANAVDAKTFPVKKHILDVALFAYGIFDGASIRLEVSPDPLDDEDPETMTWFDHPSGTFTDATEDEKRFWNNADLADVYIRAVQENSTPNTMLNFKMRPRVEMAI